jgi:hypothetical protein
MQQSPSLEDNSSYSFPFYHILSQDGVVKTENDVDCIIITYHDLAFSEIRISLRCCHGVSPRAVDLQAAFAKGGKVLVFVKMK